MLQKHSLLQSSIWIKYNKFSKVKRRKRKELVVQLDPILQNWERFLQNIKRKFLKNKIESQLLLQRINLGRWIKSSLNPSLRKSFISHSLIMQLEKLYFRILCRRKEPNYLIISLLQQLHMWLKVTQVEM
jgi:hypothetical protein